ncbi:MULTISPECIES: TerC family protein [Peribacillus]|uniref:TerC family protein n=1 Tax=Peribacillus TaxID=2675229 RepID=UPI0035C9A0F4
MDIINQILSTYALFFDWGMWAEVLTDPVSWGLIGTLIIMEGLLSADNALVLAVMVKHLPEKQRKKALMYGLIGAYFFRFLFIGIGVYLVKFWFIKVLGAAYLGWICYSHFRKKGNDDGEAKEFNKNSWLVRTFGVFWATVIMVEMMDIAFSADSILAAFAISDQVWVLLLGGMIGILLMRTVARFFLVLIDKIPELENTAFILIGIIAAKMMASVFGFHLPHEVFFAIIVLAFAITIIIHKKNAGVVKEETAVSKEE